MELYLHSPYPYAFMRYSKDSVTFSETPDHLNVFRPVTRSSQDTPLIAQFVIHCTPSPCRGDLTSLSACCCCCCCCCLDFLSSSSSWASDSATRNAHTIMLNATEGAGGVRLCAAARGNKMHRYKQMIKKEKQ